MNRVCRVVCLVLFVWIFLDGCGGDAKLQPVSTQNGCDGAMFSGILRDSLTFQPVAQGMATLESGTEFRPATVYNYFPVKSVTTDARGAFSLCVSSPPLYPSVIVLEAIDAGGKAYPPYVTFVSAAANLGTISMGGCTLTCGLANEQQTATPATITGTITSTPIALAGTVIPQLVIQALDGAKTSNGFPVLWSLAMPVFNASSTLKFSTVSGSCSKTAAFCSTFTFAVPAQSPIHPISGGTMEHATSPSYLIYVEPDNTAACAPGFGLTAFQLDGESHLTATEGAKLTAQTISLMNCY